MARDFGDVVSELGENMGNDWDPSAPPIAQEPTPVEKKDSIDDVKSQLSALQATQVATQQQAVQANVLAQLMADPDFANVIRLKQSGKKVTIAEASAATPSLEDSTELPDPDKLEPKAYAAQMHKIMMQQMEKVVGGLLEQKMAPVLEKIQAYDQELYNGRVNAAQQAVQAAMQRHTDFQEFVPQMQAINQRVGDGKLTAEQLYVLAKAEAGVPAERDTSTDTERPTTFGTRSSAEQVRRPRFAPGRVGMRDALQAAISRVRITQD